MSFLEKNKKKSFLALLLLFIRGRKTVTALLFVMVLASFFFVTPSSYIIHFPGGTRVAAAVAWVAGKLGVDTSQWGVEGGKRDFSDLLAAFRAAKEGGGKAGWAAFMRANAKSGAPAAGAGSLGVVKGSRRDRETAGGGKSSKPGTLAGVIDPDEAKRRGENETVALAGEDLTGERAGLVRTAFAGGFLNGAAPGAELSGGAYAAAGFFGTGGGGTGGGGAFGGSVGDQVKAGLSGLSTPSTAKGVAVAGGTKGKLSDSKAAAINARTSKGLAGTKPILGDKAYAQLAIGRGLDVTATAPYCTATNGCPGEFATTTSGAIYDGNAIAGSEILSAPQLDGEGTPNMPDAGVADGLINEAEKMTECAEKVNQCESAKIPANKRLGELQTSLTSLYGQLGGACGDPCNCDPCNNIQNQIRNVCDSQLPSVLAQIDKPCDLPSFCSSLGVSAPGYSISGPMKAMCTPINGGSCGSSGFLGSIMCDISSVPKCNARPRGYSRCQVPSCS